MAWDYTIRELNQGQNISGEYNTFVELSYNSYYVLKAKFASDAIINIKMEKYSHKAARGIAYLCANQEDFIGSEVQPFAYFDNIISDQGWITVNRSYFETYLYIVIEALDLDAHEESVRIYFDIDNGSSGGSDPIFTAVGSNNDSTITVEVTNLQDTDYDSLYFYVDSNHRLQTNTNPYTFYNIPDGTYFVRAQYVKNNNFYAIYTSSGFQSIEITINTGGDTPVVNNWDYYRSYSTYSNVSSVTNISESVDTYEGKYVRISFANSGTVQFQVTNGNGYIYITQNNNSWNTSSGAPYNDQGYQVSGGVSLSYTVTSGHGNYILWIRGATGSVTGNITVTVTPSTPTPTIPTYTVQAINGNQIKFVVSNKGNWHLRYFVRLTSDSTANGTRYDTWQAEGALTDNTTLIVTKDLQNNDLLYNTSYTVNVGYSSNKNSGAVDDWIGSQIVTTTSAAYCVYIYVGSGSNQGWKKAIPYIYTGSGSNQGWKQAIPYIYNGSQWKPCGE